jgi:hypothetical protein
MELRVYYKGENKLISIQRTQTMREFRAKVIEEFKIEGVEEDDLRLRGYSSYYDLYQEPYDGPKLEKTIDQLAIIGYKVFGVETKSPGEEFEPYDPNNLTVRVNLWDDAIAEIEDKTIEQKCKTPVKVSISKDSTLG